MRSAYVPREQKMMSQQARRTTSNRTFEPLLRSFFLGGFECSTHRPRNGKRLDLIAATKHDVLAESDYLRAQAQGICSVRDGLRWHLIEAQPGRYDFASALPLMEAARQTGTQVIWDLCHYGWPDHIDLFSAQFVDHFESLARRF